MLISFRIKNTEDRFGIVAIFLHWIMAVMIIGMLILGLYMVKLPVGLEKLKYYGWHKEFGISILMLAIIRIIWRIINITPHLSLPFLEKLAARTVHWAFYGLMFAMPLTGWLISSAAGLPVSFFGIFVLPTLIPKDPLHLHLYEEIHEWIAYGFIATIILHTLAALKHHFIDKDDILRRIFS